MLLRVPHPKTPKQGTVRWIWGFSAMLSHAESCQVSNERLSETVAVRLLGDVARPQPAPVLLGTLPTVLVPGLVVLLGEQVDLGLVQEKLLWPGSALDRRRAAVRNDWELDLPRPIFTTVVPARCERAPPPSPSCARGHERTRKDLGPPRVWMGERHVRLP